MKFKQKLSLLAATAALAAGFVPGVVHADAIAQAILDVNNFTLRLGDGAAGTTAAPGSLLTILGPNPSIALTSGAQAAITGVGSLNINGSTNATACVGACGFYTPNTQVVGAPLGTFSGGTGAQNGSSVGVGANAATDSIVSLKPGGDGSSGSNTNLGASFIITLSQAHSIEIAFDASSFMHGMLTKDGNATASTAWSFTITKINSPSPNLVVFGWNPNGAATGSTGVSGTVGGIEYADGFNMTDTVSALLGGDDITTSNASAHFEAETGMLATGSYRVSLRQNTNSNATLIPEPGSLALIGIAMFGAAAAARRRAAKK